MEWLCSNEKHCVSLLPRTILDAELLISLLLVFLIGAGMQYVKLSPLPAYRGVAWRTRTTADGAGKAVQRLWHLALLSPAAPSFVAIVVSAVIPSQFWATVKLIYRLGLICIILTLSRPKIQGSSWNLRVVFLFIPSRRVLGNYVFAGSRAEMWQHTRRREIPLYPGGIHQPPFTAPARAAPA